jgi:hypothetical protein
MKLDPRDRPTAEELLADVQFAEESLDTRDPLSEEVGQPEEAKQHERRDPEPEFMSQLGRRVFRGGPLSRSVLAAQHRPSVPRPVRTIHITLVKERNETPGPWSICSRASNRDLALASTRLVTCSASAEFAKAIGYKSYLCARRLRRRRDCQSSDGWWAITATTIVLLVVCISPTMT